MCFTRLNNVLLSEHENKLNKLLKNTDKSYSKFDSDANFLKIPNLDCKYYSIDDFNKVVIDNKAKNNSLSILHLNIQELNPHFDSFLANLQLIKHSFPIIALTETWLDKHSYDLFNIDGYNAVHVGRENAGPRGGGGISFFIQKHINFKIRHDLKLPCNYSVAESSFIEIQQTNAKNIIIGCIYRRKTGNSYDIENFLELLEPSLIKINKEQKTFHLTGDTNLNLLNFTTNSAIAQYLDTLFSYGMFPLITSPTRFYRGNGTLIDHIFSTDLDSNAVNGNLIINVSDHLAQFSILYSNIEEAPNETSTVEERYKRMITDKGLQKFNQILQRTNWQFLEIYNDANDKYNRFLDKLMEIYNHCFPIITVRNKNINKSQHTKPWISRGLLTSIKVKNQLYMLNTKERDSKEWIDYIKYKNTLNNLLRKAKRNYYHNLLEKYKNNIKSTWRILNSATSKKIKQKELHKIFCEGTNTITDKNIIAEKFNDFFTNIAGTLLNNIPPSNKHFQDYLKLSKNNPNTMFLHATNPQEVKQIVRHLKSCHSTGFDDISTEVVKHSIEYLSDPLSHIFNNSIQSGIVPNQLKVAKVLPLFKSGEKSEFSNYRPISLLPIFSKILEKIISKRLTNFLEKHHLLAEQQFGFRNNRSTEQANISLSHSILENIDNGNYTVGVFIDLTKAFDTVPHDILLKKLNYLGVRGVANDWFKNYLSNREQFVIYNNVKSTSKKINCGVPQGSILGPILFLIFINDIIQASQKLQWTLFADDTTIYCSEKNLNNAIEIMNLELNKLREWLLSNKLTLNIKKTKYMIFSSYKKSIHYNEELSPVKINNEPLERVKTFKFLGVTLQENLQWNCHVNQTCTKLSKAIAMLHRVKTFLPKKSLITLYNSFFLSHLNYCSLVWNFTTEANVRKIKTLQKRAIRIITSSPFREHTVPLFRDEKILPVELLFQHRAAMFMYDLHRGTIPTFISSKFLFTNSIHQHNTRSTYFHIRNSLKQSQHTIIYEGIKVWENKIPDHCKHTNNKNSFKKKFKEYLLHSI